MQETTVSQFYRARSVSVPLVAIASPDPAATIREIIEGSKDEEATFVVWDIARGFTEPAERKYGVRDALLNKGLEGHELPDETGKYDVPAMLDIIRKVPGKCCVFMCLADKFYNCPQQGSIVIQAILNLRDRFKAVMSTLVMLCHDAAVPAELKNDVLIIDEPLPDSEQLGQIVDKVVVETRKKHKDFPLTDLHREAAIDRVTGLSAFAAEQALCLSLRKAGIDLAALWERKRKMIEQAKGLSVYGGTESFDDIGGVENIKRFMRGIIDGQEPPQTIVFVDEIEKAVSGAGGDTSGVSGGFLQTLLQEMQDTEATGCIFIGPPGAAKSAVAKATGNEAGCLTISLDLNGMKGSLVGQSEAGLRDALKVIRAVSQNKTLWLATCNSIGSVPVELRRRFNFGTFFFDLPTAEERKVIWKLYLARFALNGKQVKTMPNDEGWTGAEIKTCCDLARRMKWTIAEAAKYIVPVSRSAAKQIEGLRRSASGAYISASDEGVYQYVSQEERDDELRTGRDLQLVD
jgi:SpoVK/Ycf46/Vps4 family AAA+-type ATPase